MYLGHSFLAFAVVAAIGLRLDVDRRRLLVLAGLAAAYGLLPDVDTWRTGYVFLRAGPEGVFPTEQYVWRYSWVIHRALTHSVVTGSIASVLAGLVVLSLRRTRTPLRVASAGIVAVATGLLLLVARSVAGTPGVVTIALFLAGALGLAVVGYRRRVTARAVTAAAGVGLLTHPFGDFWMGQPPALLAPLNSSPPFDGMALSGDPVLHFLGAVAIEVALLGCCVHLACAITGRDTLAYLSPFCLVGLGYAAVLGSVPHPTFAEAYQFATGLFLCAAGVVLVVFLFDRHVPVARGRALVSGVAAFGLGLVGYAAAYALVG